MAENTTFLCVNSFRGGKGWLERQTAQQVGALAALTATQVPQLHSPVTPSLGDLTFPPPQHWHACAQVNIRTCKLKTNYFRERRDVPAIKNTHCSSRGPESSSQHRDSQLPVSPAPGDPMPLVFSGTCTHPCAHIHRHRHVH